MKRQERHHLKENELAHTMEAARESLDQHKNQLVYGGVAVVVVALLVGGYALYQSSVNAKASALLADAIVVAETPVAPLPASSEAPPTPANPPAPANGKTFPTTQAKLEAALPKFLAAANAYPSTQAGIAARYHAAATLAELGRTAEAAKEYQDVVAKAGGTIYARTAELGLAEAQLRSGQVDAAISVYRKLSGQADSELPADAILMHLGRALLAKGDKAEAAKAFSRVVDEHPQSPFVADARKERDALKDPKA